MGRSLRIITRTIPGLELLLRKYVLWYKSNKEFTRIPSQQPLMFLAVMHIGLLIHSNFKDVYW